MTCITDSLSIPRGATFAVALRIPEPWRLGPNGLAAVLRYRAKGI